MGFMAFAIYMGGMHAYDNAGYGFWRTIGWPIDLGATIARHVIAVRAGKDDE